MVAVRLRSILLTGAGPNDESMIAIAQLSAAAAGSVWGAKNS